MKLHMANFNWVQSICTLTSPPDFNSILKWDCERFLLYFKVKLKLWRGSRVACDTLEVGEIDVQPDISSSTSTSC
jgi:hypothetical protein